MDPEDELEDDFSLDEEVDQDLPDQDETPEDDADVDLDGLDDVEDEPAPRQSRGDNRVATATREAKEAKEALARLEREMAEIRASTRPQTPQETPQQREQRLAALDPYERLQIELQETRQETRLFQQRLEFETRDNADKVAYDALAQRAPVAAKLKDEVEKRLADMRAAGTTAPRETVLRWVIGDRALANAGKATTRARTAAAGNKDRQAARAPSGRGDVAAEGRNNSSTKAREKRLESYNL